MSKGCYIRDWCLKPRSISGLVTRINRPVYHEHSSSHGISRSGYSFLVQDDDRGVVQDKSCQLCVHNTEDALHMLRDCPWARDIWTQGKSMRPEQIIKVSYCWAKQHSSIHSEALVMGTQQTSGSAESGVIYDEKRNWVLGYNRFLGKCSVIVTELWSILDGKLILQKQGYDKVVIQFDNLEIVIAISDRKLEGSTSNLIKRIQQILAKEEKWLLRYVPNENNKFVYALAKMAPSNDDEVLMFDETPIEIQGIL
ncbi:hypothetical protein Gotur_019806 [Gossypium turneri]